MSTYLITSSGLPVEHIEAVDIREAERIAQRRHAVGGGPSAGIQVHLVTGGPAVPASQREATQTVQLTEAREAELIRAANRRVAALDRDLDAELREALGELGLGESSVIRAGDGEVIAATGPATKKDLAEVAKLEDELVQLDALFLKRAIAKDEYDRRRAELKAALATANARAAGGVDAASHESHESARSSNLDEQLVEAFRALGNDDATARAMAAGR